MERRNRISRSENIYNSAAACTSRDRARECRHEGAALMNHHPVAPPSSIDRRQMLAQSAGLAAIGGLGLGSLALGRDNVSEQPVVTKGNIHQSLVYWCFSKYWDVEKTC